MASPVANNELKNALINRIPLRIFAIVKEHYYLDSAMPNEELPTDLRLQAADLDGSVLKDKIEARDAAVKRKMEVEEKEVESKDREIVLLRRQVQDCSQGLHGHAEGEDQ